MKTLEEAWQWYSSTQKQAELLGRLARRHWEALPWEGDLGRDDHFRSLNGEIIQRDSDFCLEHLPDLAVVVLFSMFEGTVRENVLEELRSETPAVLHRVLKQALEEAKQNTRDGSFCRVLEPYKEINAELVELVNQVRRYRNWVAHGRRGEPPDGVTPSKAHERLTRFLREFGMSES